MAATSNKLQNNAPADDHAAELHDEERKPHRGEPVAHDGRGAAREQSLREVREHRGRNGGLHAVFV
jgi:hypothetical protein